MPYESLLQRVDSLERDMVDVLMEFIRVPTVSPSGENYGEFADKAVEVLDRYGIRSRVISVPQDYVDSNCPPEARGNPRYIVEAVLEGGGGVVDFNGHYDVVPGGPGWSITEPFNPVLRNGRVYGRGAVDMKGGLVSVLAAFIALREEGYKPRYTARLFMVPDEEIGGECGTGWLVDNLDTKPLAVFIPEPSGTRRVWHGHKGALWVEVMVKGKTAHASTPWMGVNAFEKASRMAIWLFDNYVPVVSSIVSGYKYDLEGAERATAMIGGVAGVEGGGKTNQVPGGFYFTIDRRVNPEESVESARIQLEEYLEKAASTVGAEYSVRVIHSMEPALTPPDSVAVRMIADAAGKLGVRVEPTVCMGGLDLHYYTSRGIPAASYGPGNNTPHAPDEYIEVEELKMAAKVYAVMLAG